MKFPPCKERKSIHYKQIKGKPYRILPNFDCEDSYFLKLYTAILYEIMVLLDSVTEEPITDDLFLRAAAMKFEECEIEIRPFLKDLIQNAIKMNEKIKDKVKQEKAGKIDEYAV